MIPIIFRFGNLQPTRLSQSLWAGVWRKNFQITIARIKLQPNLSAYGMHGRGEGGREERGEGRGKRGEGRGEGGREERGEGRESRNWGGGRLGRWKEFERGTSARNLVIDCMVGIIDNAVAIVADQ